MKNVFPAVALLCVFALVSCKKNQTSVVTTYNLSLLHSGLGAATQNFTVAAGTSQTIVGAKGTVLNFYPTSFKDQQGNTITSGTVSIGLVEVTKPGDMIANNTNTMCNGLLLQSGGEVNITATMNGKTVYANNYGIGFVQPGASTKPMQLFYGNYGNLQTASPIDNPTMNWSLPDTTKGTTAYSTNTNLCYMFDSCTSFGWINCDHFYNQPTAEIGMTVVVPDNSFDNLNTQIYIVYPSINSVQNFVGPYTKFIHAFGKMQSKLPVGVPIELVALAYKDGQYYYFDQKGITPVDGLVITANLTSDSKENIVAKLAAL